MAIVIDEVEAEVVPELRAAIARTESQDEAPAPEPAVVRRVLRRLAVRAARVRAD
jgi:uncharacterized protein (DUF2126 family)